MMFVQSRSRCRAGFTLIELLVVIVILAILVAIFFPLFAQSREKARGAACLSNLKQLGAAIQLYADAFDGAYPAAQAHEDQNAPPPVSEEQSNNWAELVYPYIKSGATAGSGRVRFNEGVFHCPSDKGSRGPSYAINAWVLFGLKEPQVARTAETVLVAEKRANIPREIFVWWQDPWPAWPLRAGTPIKPSEPAINAIDEAQDEDNPGPDEEEKEMRGLQTLRHQEGANWLFADGHAKWASLERIWGNATSENQLWPTRP